MHSHTGYVAHGRGTVDELVRAAVDAGLSTLGITEHNWLSERIDPTHWVGMERPRVSDYLADIARAREQYPQITLVAGMEMDYLGSAEDRIIDPAELAPFDYLLGSVHYVDGWAMYSSKEADKWGDQEHVDALWRRYFEVWCEAASGPMPYTVMSHPDLVKKHGRYASFDVAPLYEQAAEAARAGERMVEVNTSGDLYVCGQVFPAPDLLRQFCRAGVPCTVGTDAHCAQNVARNVQQAYEYMYEAGYRQVTVPMPGGDRRTIPLEG
ncbi:MAG: histidinol-phosphatase HisJ family protein [Coriobacteriia bacterium]|nr:histidinol-phosphatase HisJ family protein [Coriobacteriia bacterium]